MAREKSPLLIHLEYYPLRALVFLFTCLPTSAGRLIAQGLLNGILFFLPKRRALIRDNIALSFPEKSPREQASIYQNSLENFSRGLAIYGKMTLLSRRYKDHFIVVDGLEHLHAALRDKKGAITFTAHYGCWEMMAIHITHYYPLIAMVARPLDNPRLDAFCTSVRSSGGGKVIPSRKIFKEGMPHLRDNGVLGILIDQNFARDGGIFVDFLGRPASTTPIVSILARRTGCSVLPMYNRWEGNRLRIVCEPVMALSQNSDPEKAVLEDTQAMTKVVERWVRQDPGQWFWMHNRWKRQPTET